MAAAQAVELQPYLEQLQQLLEEREELRGKCEQLENELHPTENTSSRELSSIWLYVGGFAGLVLVEMFLPRMILILTMFVTIGVIIALIMAARARAFHFSHLFAAVLGIIAMWLTPFFIFKQVPYAILLYPVGLFLVTITLRNIEKAIQLAASTTPAKRVQPKDKAQRQELEKLEDLRTQLAALDTRISADYRHNLPRKYLNLDAVSGLLQIVETKSPQNMPTAIRMYEVARKR